eukprot:2318743-Pleurochrysis_carterae.AAC.1
MYRTRAAQFYPSNMNAALADSLLVRLTSTAAALRDAGGVDEICSDDEHSDNIHNLFDESDAGDIELVMGLKTHGDDNPTWAQAMRKRRGESLARRSSNRDAELRATRSLRRSQRGLTPIMEYALEACIGSDRHDVTAVLRKKKDDKGNLLKYKARAV